MAEKMTVWKDRDNPIYITMTEDGTNLTVEQMEAITKVEIFFDGVYYSSADYSDCFDLASKKDESKIIIYPGLLPLPDDHATQDYAELIIYDASNTNGIVWMQFVMIVMTDAEKAS